MAQFRRITRSNPVSNFRQEGPQGGQAFTVLAGAAQELYNRLAPAAVEKMKASGAEEGARLARAQVGNSGLRTSTKGVSLKAETAFTALQAAWGSPLSVISAYRDPEHNERVGGAKNSQHIHGNAFDVDVSGMSQEERVRLIRQARAAGFRVIRA